MENFHPVVEILLKQFDITHDSIKPLREQLLAYKDDTDGLKEVLIKHNILNEVKFQKALAQYFELEYRDNFDDVQVLREYTEFIPIRYAKKYQDID